MVDNQRYLAHKLDPTGDHAPYVGVANPLPLSPVSVDSEAYSYIPCQPPVMAAEPDTYEVMKPSGTVKNTLSTTDNICYSCNGH